MSSFEPIPLAIGFSGHRDISPEDEERLRDKLKERLGKLKSANHPLRAFSGLAEGADMLFAEAATELKIELIVVMPVEVDDFVRDFDKPAHPDRKSADLLKRFETLRGMAAAIHVVPIPSGVTAEQVKRYGPERDAQYTAVGAYIVRQSAILIALWDGVATDKRGGTSDVVRFKRDGVPPQPGETEYFPAPPDGGPVMPLGATRMDSMGGAEPHWHEVGYPEPGERHRIEFDKALRRLRDFNRDARATTQRHEAIVATSLGYLLPPDVELEPAAQRLVEAYAATDATAMVLQKKAHWVLAEIVSAAIAMVVFFEFFEHVWPTEFWLLGYVVAFAVAYAIYLFELWRKTYPRFLDYRCLAEGLRVQIFWHLSGLDEAVADHYLHRQRGELRWIRDALRSFMIHLPAAPPRLELVRKRWVADQANYFKNASADAEHADKLSRRSVGALFGIGFAIAVALAVFGLLNVGLPEQLRRAMIFFGAFLPALAAAIKGFAGKRAFSEHAKQYARMARVFSLARRRLDSVNDTTLTDRTRGVLLELGREALAENAEWILLHRERQIEPAM